MVHHDRDIQSPPRDAIAIADRPLPSPLEPAAPPLIDAPSARSPSRFPLDGEPFETLQALVVPTLVERRTPDGVLRIWIPGCATGEEAYAIAICLLEQLGDRDRAGIRIFASDIDDAALSIARRAEYPTSIEGEIAPRRLLRFFVRSERGYRIQRAVRDLMVFSHHDVTADPPFSRVDLVCCRNLLHAMSPAVRGHVLRALHYALAPDGFLALGLAEVVPEIGERFLSVGSAPWLFTGRVPARGTRDTAPPPALAPDPVPPAPAGPDPSVQRRLERVELIGKATTAVGSALAAVASSDLRSFYQVVVDQARRVAEAEFAALGFGGAWGHTFDPWVVSGLSHEHTAAIGRAPQGVGLLGAVVHTGRPIRVRSVSEHAAISDLPAHHPVMTSFLGVPIRYNGTSRASLYFANKLDGSEFTEADQLAIEMFTERVGIAIEIARLRQVESREHTRLELLARAGALLAEPIDYDSVFDAVACVVVPTLADLCAVDLVEDDGSVTKVGTYHVDPSRQQLLDRLLGTTSRDQIPGELRAAIDTAQPQLRDRDPEFLRCRLPVAEHRRLVEEIGATCTIAAPLVVRGRVVGLLHLAMAGSGRRYAPRDLSLAGEVAHHAALAIERARLYRAARTAIDARDDLLAFVTHDLHNYLATIRVSAGTLTAQGMTGERSSLRPLDLIGRTVTHMGRLIDGLRDATMIETGQFTMAIAAVDPAAIIAEAADTLAPQAEARSLQLATHVEPELPDVPCDRERVLQVIANLVGNAIKFTPTPGRIRIAASQLPDAVKISISDTGPGIPEPLLARVFDRYWHGGNPGSGTGLGLFISKGIVEAHGGRIWADSATGAGATFHFTLPFAGPHPP